MYISFVSIKQKRCTKDVKKYPHIIFFLFTCVYLFCLCFNKTEITHEKPYIIFFNVVLYNCWELYDLVIQKRDKASANINIQKCIYVAIFSEIA